MVTELEYLENLAKTGGPEEREYDEFTNIITSLNKKRKKGIVSESDLNSLFMKYPSSFYSKETMQGFIIIKPHGYSGDFEIIERIYSFWESKNENLINWDKYFHAQIAPCAVRNRKEYFINVLNELEQKNKAATVLNVASGPVTDVVEYLSSGGSVHFDCVDYDKNAILYSKNKLKQYLDQILFYNANIFHLNLKKQYELVWSAGLTDYLEDRMFKILLKKMFRLLKDGGELIFGNFSQKNTTQNYMWPILSVVFPAFRQARILPFAP